MSPLPTLCPAQFFTLGPMVCSLQRFAVRAQDGRAVTVISITSGLSLSHPVVSKSNSLVLPPSETDILALSCMHTSSPCLHFD